MRQREPVVRARVAIVGVSMRRWDATFPETELLAETSEEHVVASVKQRNRSLQRFRELPANNEINIPDALARPGLLRRGETKREEWCSSIFVPPASLFSDPDEGRCSEQAEERRKCHKFRTNNGTRFWRMQKPGSCCRCVRLAFPVFSPSSLQKITDFRVPARNGSFFPVGF